MAKQDEAQVLTDLSDVRDEQDREAIIELVKRSKQLFVARDRESTEKSQKTDLWEMIQSELAELNSDLSFELDGVKLTWSRGGMFEQNVPDEIKIEEVGADLIAQQYKLKAELSNIEWELDQLAKAHTKVSEVEVKPKLTVNVLKAKAPKKKTKKK